MNKQSSDQPNNETIMPDTKEVLGDHLYQKVTEILNATSPELPRKVTGMLMECRTSDIYIMLKDSGLLKSRILEAQACLGVNSVCGDDGKPCLIGSEEKLELGYRLFEKVSEIESCLCAQITGMLLELDHNMLMEALGDKRKLQYAVEKAKATYLTHHKLSTCNDNSMSQRNGHMAHLTQRDEIGERLFEIIEETYPEEAAKITGMLLEMDPKALNGLLEDEGLLWDKVSKARQVLLESAAQSH